MTDTDKYEVIKVKGCSLVICVNKKVFKRRKTFKKRSLCFRW